MVPTNLVPTGLDVALGWPGVGLGRLLLLGPACEAGGPDPACSLEVLVMVMALGGDLGLLASLAMAACFCCHLCLCNSFITVAAPLWTEPSHNSTL